ncbi:MAG: DUF4278 domain-containing protein [Spirulinaceae cyanobacterium RM2_2_10]|nr:DUF4278 domain-containing protein [Spirulinaceae cyanobacterium SM2_1_0]NJO21294.1 DUF4278 domain-containing protein [Spirulinaceae cyanobacterium RM2_2_10]
MKLSYRGHSYEANTNPVAGQDIAVPGTYRGTKTTLHMTRVPVQHQTPLTYRGVRHLGG